MLPSFWQVATCIVFATFGIRVAFSDRLCDQSGQHCLVSSARDLLRQKNTVKEYFQAQRDLERNAVDSRITDNRDSSTRELDGRSFDPRTNRFYKVYEDRSLSAERDLSWENMRSSEADNERTRSQRNRNERRMNQSDQRSLQRRERQDRNDIRHDLRSTLKTVSGRSDNQQRRLSLKMRSEGIVSTVDMNHGNRQRFILNENSQETRHLLGSFNTRREMSRASASRRQVDDLKQNRGIVENQEESQERDVENRNKSERREPIRGSSDRHLRQKRSEYSRLLTKRSFNSSKRFDINRNVDASIRRKSRENNNGRINRDLREVRNVNREETRTQERERRLESSKMLDTRRDGQRLETFKERLQTRNMIGLRALRSERTNDRFNERDEYGLQTLRLQHAAEQKVHDKSTRNEIRYSRRERTTERRIQGTRTELKTVQTARNIRYKIREEHDDERKVRDSSAQMRGSRNTKLGREIEQMRKVRTEWRDDRNANLEREDKQRMRNTSEKRHQSQEIFRGLERENDFKDAQLQLKSERRIHELERSKRSLQEARAERRDARNIRFKGGDERWVRDDRDERRDFANMRLERESERRVQEIRPERRNFRNTRLRYESEQRQEKYRAERHSFRNIRFERADERWVRDTRDERLGSERESERSEHETRAENRDARNTRVERESKRREQETRAERRDSRNLRLQRRQSERRMHDASAESREHNQQRLQKARVDNNIAFDTILKREDERRVRDTRDEGSTDKILERESERRVQEVRAERRDSRHARLERESERKERETSGERRNLRNTRLEDERIKGHTRDERLESERNSRLGHQIERRERTGKGAENRGLIRLERENERKVQGTRNERHASERIMKFECENERREQATRFERRESRNIQLEREGERRLPDTRDEKRVMRVQRKEQEVRAKNHEVWNTQFERENERRIHSFHVERYASRNTKSERQDAQKVRDADEERRQNHRIEHLDATALADSLRRRSFKLRVEVGDDIIRSSNRRISQLESFKNLENLHIQMLQALLIGMILLKVVMQQNTFAKKINFTADRFKNIISVGARKFF